MMQPPSYPEQITATGAATLHGRRVGPYQLESELGRGGMGSVWLARRDDGYYEGKVAIKLLVASWFGTQGAARFRQEGKLLARLDHPNIARLQDAGITDLGEPYLVLEYIEGQRIDVYCANARLGLRSRIKLFLELLGAVAHAHRNLVVHRDIKPANVLITAGGQAKLLDFGIGKLVQDEEDELTSTGQRILTPQFAAPEQLLGEPITTATDIYALGLLLYVLLTGQLPHSGSPAELIRRITTGDMPPPSSVAMTQMRLGAEIHAAPLPSEIARTVRRELRGDLDNIVLKALQAAPGDRYEDVGAFAADLRRFLRNEPVSARRSTLSYRVGKFAQRNRTGVVASVLVAAAVTVGSITTLSQAIEARRQRAEAEYQARSVQVVADFLNLSLFSEGGPDRPALSMAERIERGVKLIESQHGDEPSFAGQMLLQLSARLGAAGDLQSLLRLLKRAQELGDQAGDLDLMAQAECATVTALVQSGQLQTIDERMQKAQRLMSAQRPHYETTVVCLVAQAKVAQSQTNRDRAVSLLEQAATVIEREGATIRPFYSTVLSMLGNAYSEQNNFAAALRVNQRAVQLDERFGRADTSEHLTILQNAATMLQQVGEVVQSHRERERINLLMRKFSAADETPLIYTINQDILLLRLARAPVVLATIAPSVERARKAGNPVVLLHLLHVHAWAALDTHDPRSAAAALAEAQKVLDQGIGTASMRSYFELRKAQLELAQKNLVAARKHADTALSLIGYGTERTERQLGRILLGAAEIALASGRHADAQRFATDALRAAERVARGQESSADVGESLLLRVKSQPNSPAAERRAQLQRAVRCLSNGLGAEHPLSVEAREMLAATVEA